MTDIEIKGKELIEKFYNSNSEGETGWMTRADAKACALICVDEIINELRDNTGARTREAFWQSVRAYIEGSK